jgi:hypothetical protein
MEDFIGGMAWFLLSTKQMEPKLLKSSLI